MRQEKEKAQTITAAGYEASVSKDKPKAEPKEILAYLIAEHSLKQSDLPEIGSQGVISELLSIVDYERFNPTIDSNYFPETQVNNYYWTALSVASNSVTMRGLFILVMVTIFGTLRVTVTLIE